ncbi:ABC transporter permease [Fulvivirgaceae bacterium BMA10]|uniref:ABC transporter permease n=1 Tax=Splendidivirga corallicola TaxID=3051826 RepID=A0ABT8KWX1_9BACT|nr:ABC transporter permease [Fulvivirgaceae bacterium BMA10]
MVKNYIKITLRNLAKNKVHSAINISGLSIGMACVILILLFIQNELSYDKFHENSKNIYRIAWFSDNPQTRTPHPMAQAMVNDFPEVVSAVSLSPIWGPGLTKQTFSIKNLEKNIQFDEPGVLSVDSTFFDVFSFKLTRGDQTKVLRNIGGLLISETMAQKYFAQEDPIGKQLAINDDQTLLQVEGVFANVPDNAHFHFDFLVSYVTLKAFSDPESEYYEWTDFGHFNYIKLHPKSNIQALEDKLMPWVAGHLDISQERLERLVISNTAFRLQPLEDIHLKSNIRWELESNGNMGYVYIMSAAALFILIIACVNFVNLSIGKSIERVKEIGVRKASGASRKEIASQFLGESILTTLLALIITGLLIEVTLPLFNNVTGKSLNINYFQQPEMILILLTVGGFVGVISGIYPALYLSSIKSSQILKGHFKASTKGKFLSKTLVILQFSISMVLITGSIIIYGQLNFIKNKDLGFGKEQVIVIPSKSSDISDHFQELKTSLLNISGVESVSAASNVPGGQFNQNPIYLSRDDQNIVNASEFMVDFDILKTLNLEVIEGRGFSIDHTTDSSLAFIINETAVRALNIETPIGEALVWNADGPLFKGTVIGVVKDFHFKSLHQPIRPIIMRVASNFNHVMVKLNSKDYTRTIESIRNAWNVFDEDFQFEYTFLDESIDRQYRAEEKMAQVFSGFSLLAATIACFGLLGLAILLFGQRTKEIGVRKALGASIPELMTLLIKDFTKLMAIAILIGGPIAWWIMNNWLQNFTFRITINPAVFLLTGLLILFIAWATLGYLTFKVAKANPVDTLRDE